MQKHCMYYRPGDPASCQRGDECGYLHTNNVPPNRRYSTDRPRPTSPRSPNFIENKADGSVVIPPISFFARPVSIPPPQIKPEKTPIPKFKAGNLYDASKYKYVATRASPEQPPTSATPEKPSEGESSTAAMVATLERRSTDKGKADLVYSKRLTDATIALFCQERYRPGFIPLVPPTKDLI